MTATVTSQNNELPPESPCMCSASASATETAQVHKCVQNSHAAGSDRCWFRNSERS